MLIGRENEIATLHGLMSSDESQFTKVKYIKSSTIICVVKTMHTNRIIKKYHAKKRIHITTNQIPRMRA